MKHVWMCDHVSGNCDDCNDMASRFFITKDDTRPIMAPTLTQLKPKPCPSAKRYVILSEEEYKMLKGK